MASVLLALLGAVSAPEEFATTKEGCGRKFLTRILCVCVCKARRKRVVYFCVWGTFILHHIINRNISKSSCTWNRDQRINIPVFFWLEMKKFHYLLVLRGGSFPSSDLQQESLIFCGILGPCEAWQICTFRSSYPQKQDQHRRRQWASLHVPVTIPLARAPKRAVLRTRGQFSHR